jgi:hypothetical protein
MIAAEKFKKFRSAADALLFAAFNCYTPFTFHGRKFFYKVVKDDVI